MHNSDNWGLLAGALYGDGPTWKGCRPRGVPLVLVLSAEEALQLRPRSAHGVIVSIRDPGSTPVALDSRWEDVLRVELRDLSVNGRNDPTPESLAPQARAIADFVHNHRQAPLLAFNCHSGMSRSRTVASVVCEHYEWPYEWFRLHHALRSALETAFASRVRRATARRNRS
jgi:predicted protein tyrosine phosphatase